MALASGTRFARGYTIQSVIAAGGFGITYLGTHDALQRACAIKEHFPRQFAYRDSASSDVRPTDPATYGWALDRFIQEGRSLARCSHPNVVGVADVFEANGTAYMVLNYEDGSSFKNWLDGLKRPPTKAEIDRLLAPLLDALDFVHGQGLLHRDIAPDNIMIRTDGTPCLIDFGAARQAMAQRSQVMSAIVKTGYSPPEQYTTSGRAQGPWSDIYALGATLYRAVSGRVPPEATERQIDDELLPTAQDVASREAYRPSFLAGIDAALRLKQAERPQTVAAWRAMLSAVSTPRIDGSASTTAETAAVREVTFSGLPGERPVTPRRPRRTSVLAVALVAVLLAAGGSYAFRHAMTSPITDPALLAELNKPTDKHVKDPAILARLEYDIDITGPHETVRKAIDALPAKQREGAMKLWAARNAAEVEAAKRKADDEARTRAETERQRLAMLQPPSVVGITVEGSERAVTALDLARARQRAHLANLSAQTANNAARSAAHESVIVTPAQDQNAQTIAAEAKRRAEDETRRRDPIAALVPGSRESARDRLVDGSACSFCPEMVVAPAGGFTMGSPESEPQRGSDEQQVLVTIARPFAVGKFAVTFDEWDACVADGGCNGHKPGDQGWGRGKRPVINVHWDDAKTYAAWLSQKTGKTYRLLSEAERKYATRAGTTTPFWWGSSIAPAQANYNGSVEPYKGGGSKGEYRQRTLPVESFQPNPWGLYQVHGNLWEWTEDCWIDRYTGNPGNGEARTTGCTDAGRRVVCGGSWHGDPQFLRSAFRARFLTRVRFNNLGFRLARTLNP